MNLIPLITNLGYKLPTSTLLLALLEDPYPVMRNTLTDKLVLELGPIKLVIHIDQKVEVIHEGKTTTIQDASPVQTSQGPKEGGQQESVSP
jgi:hypothetical protein